MGYGGYHPYPRRFGGNPHNGKPLTEVIHRSLNAQRGPAYNTEDNTTVVSIENLAYARAIAYDGWETNARIALQWDPYRVTDMRDRWESIFKIRPTPNASDRSRRAELVRRWQRFGGITNHARMVTELQAALGDFFVAVEYIALSIATVHVPDASYPWGTVASGVTWSSSVAHFLVRLQKPTGATEGDFYEAAGAVALKLDPIQSAFTTFDWYRPGPIYTNISGGPSAAGFYLDNDHNLDNEVFDLDAPRISSVTPSSGPTTGGTSVVLGGIDFTNATTVTIGGVPVAFTVDSNNRITITATSVGAAGVVDIVVTTPFGAFTATASFTYVQAALSLTSLTPSTGPNAGGTAFVIAGTGLNTATDVTINGFSLAVWSIVDDNTINATTDAVGGPETDFVVVTDGVTSPSLPFTFT